VTATGLCNNLQHVSQASGLSRAVALSDPAAMTTHPARILVVDDDPELRALLQRYLSENGHKVRAVVDGKALDAALAREPADALVLDLMLGAGEDGLAICRRLRNAGDETPILMLTARGDPVDRIVGLEMGADDYLAKPFTPRELLARLSAILRRARAGPTFRDTVVRFGPFALNLQTMSLERDGVAVDISSREFALLAALASRPGRPLSRAQLIEMALGREAEVTDRAIDVQVARLRKAIETDPAEPMWIKTVWGVGYVFAGAAKP
jgi:two-component system, OmpR family, phosphate regulon response regulator OmpR